MLRVQDFDYYLPPELIAQQPVKPRDHSRLLLLNRKKSKVIHRHFFDLPDYLNSGDLLVLNNSKVFPARLIGYKKQTGGQVEIFLHRAIKKISNAAGAANIWECLVGGRAKEGLEINFYNSNLKSRMMLVAVIIKNNQDGTWQVKFNKSGPEFWRVVNKIGEVPLPPYIKRSKQLASDKKSYQTVFADSQQIGSAAAPTAGLHFTKYLLKKIKARGVKVSYVTLHVGLGTFAPVKVDKISDHRMHSEFAAVSAATIREIIKTKERGGRVIAVGTTSCRTLESLNWADIKKESIKKIKKQTFWTKIFIYPGYNFQIVDALVTNFHLPKSTLLMLISALAGQKLITLAYREAIQRRYRFFSYGDAMLIY
jgi:S-adenosylmethionine:tRNA ribosyltransferase-isomerase